MLSSEQTNSSERKPELFNGKVLRSCTGLDVSKASWAITSFVSFSEKPAKEWTPTCQAFWRCKLRYTPRLMPGLDRYQALKSMSFQASCGGLFVALSQRWCVGQTVKVQDTRNSKAVGNQSFTHLGRGINQLRGIWILPVRMGPLAVKVNAIRELHVELVLKLGKSEIIGFTIRE